MRLIYCLLLLTSSLCVRAQSNAEVRQLYALISKSPFLLRKPANPSNRLQRLSLNDTLTLDYGARLPAHRIDTKRLAEIIAASSSVDTTRWDELELVGVVWVDNSTQRLTINDLLHSLPSADKQLQGEYQKRIRKYNGGIATASNNFYDGLVASLSKPVFDKERRYAVLMRDYFHLGGEIFLFEKEKEAWHIVGILDKWAY
jgi:hypothetical protein